MISDKTPVYKNWSMILLSVLAIGMPLVFLPFVDGIDIFDTAKGTLLFSIGFVLALWTIRTLKHYTWDLTDGLLIAWLMVLLCSVFSSNNWYLGFLGHYKHQGRSEGLITFLIYFICFRTARLAFNVTTRHLNLYLWILTSIVVYALIQYLYLDPLVYFKNFRPTVFSTVGNQNFLATLLQLLMFLALALFLKYLKTQHLILAFIYAIGILITQTRSVWFSSILGCILFLVLLFYYYKTIHASYVVFLIALAGMALLLNQRPNWFNAKHWNADSISSRGLKGMNDFINPTLESGSGRLYIWKLSLSAVKAHPFLGTGPEQLKAFLQKSNSSLYKTYKYNRGKTIDKAHNEFLHIAATQGLIALMVYLFFLIYIAFKAYKKRQHPWVAGLVLIVFVHLLQACFNISVIAVAPVYWILLGVLYAQVQDTNASKLNSLNNL
ncbi:MAG: O-antigen ligase family protein [Bacteroidia bacterium]|jgi:putative inorganic carbon (HCO3(-)) transporter